MTTESSQAKFTDKNLLIYHLHLQVKKNKLESEFISRDFKSQMSVYQVLTILNLISINLSPSSANE